MSQKKQDLQRNFIAPFWDQYNLFKKTLAKEMNLLGKSR